MRESAIEAASQIPHPHPYSLAAESATARRRLTTLGLSTRGTSCALTTFMSDKRIVYVIRSRKDPERHYVGLTSDLPSRLASHNAGESPQTRTLIPWALVVSVQFASADAAIRFERFLKSSSGRAFAKHYFE
jgi:putative endonuclease